MMWGLRLKKTEFKPVAYKESRKNKSLDEFQDEDDDDDKHKD